jgi:hypothetical protein
MIKFCFLPNYCSKLRNVRSTITMTTARLLKLFISVKIFSQMNVPEEIKKKAINVASSLLPAKSLARYEREYEEFKNWQKNNNVTGVTADVLLVYLHQLSEKFSPNSLWSKWSMLKSCLEIKENAEVRRLVFLFLTLSKKLYFNLTFVDFIR